MRSDGRARSFPPPQGLSSGSGDRSAAGTSKRGASQRAHVERLARAFGADGELQVEWPWAAEATSRSSFDLSGSCDLTCRPSEPGSVHKTTGWMRGDGVTGSASPPDCPDGFALERPREHAPGDERPCTDSLRTGALGHPKLAGRVGNSNLLGGARNGCSGAAVCSQAGDSNDVRPLRSPAECKSGGLVPHDTVGVTSRWVARAPRAAARRGEDVRLQRGATQTTRA